MLHCQIHARFSQGRPADFPRTSDTTRQCLLETTIARHSFWGFDPVKSAPFTYHAPKTVDDAVAMLAEFAPADGRILAGGQSLVPMMAFRMARPAHLIDINPVDGLNRLAVEENALSIAACVRHAAFHRPVVEGPTGALLSDIVSHIAHYPIRLRGTFCGSLAHADPASEWCLTAVTLGLEIVAASRRGRRVIASDKFFEGMMTTALAEDELLVEARLPLLSPDTRCGFYEFSRRAGDYALAMALVTFRLQDGIIVEPRIGIGGAGVAAPPDFRGGGHSFRCQARSGELPHRGGSGRGGDRSNGRRSRRCRIQNSIWCAP